MGTKKLIQEYYRACLSNDIRKEGILFKKALKKSLKHKNTMVIK